MLLNGHFLRILTRWTVIVACLATTWLYLYPVLLGCVFPTPDGHITTALRETLSRHFSHELGHWDTTTAPFRLLIFADPQLEGDSSLPDPEDALGYKLSAHWDRFSSRETWNTAAVTDVLQEVIFTNIPTALKELRKRIDLFGNDYYLAHIFRTLHRWTKPTHVTVLGDLIGSQWVDDDEFERRGWRFWNRVFAGGHRVEDEIMATPDHGGHGLLPMDDPSWNRRIINIAGNHDIGYAGDISKDRMNRFERTFGKANWDIRFEYPRAEHTTYNEIQPTLHMVVLNSMLLDTPAMDSDLQDITYEYLNSVITKRSHPVEDDSSFTLLLTHVPLHKDAGICVDAPFFDFHDDTDCSGECKPYSLKEQNHLSMFASRAGLLESLFGMSGKPDTPKQGKGRHGLILNGHDHEGCDTWHYIPGNTTLYVPQGEEESKTNWQCEKQRLAQSETAHTGIREITLRSMMGEYGGNAGLLSMWYDFEDQEWRYDMDTCMLGIQHIWWAVHVLDIIAVGLLACSLIQMLLANLIWQTKLYSAPELRAKKNM